MLDDLTGATFRIVINRERGHMTASLSKHPLTQAGDAVVVESWNDGVVSVNGVITGTDTYRQLSKWFALHQCAAAVVRPDGYVFGAAGTFDEVPHLLTELASHIVGP
jgi:hypothetical protein